MKQRPKSSVFALSGKDNKPVQRFQVLSTKIDYPSVRWIYVIDQRFDDNDTPNNSVSGDVSVTDGSNDHEHNMTIDDDTSDINDGNHNDGKPLLPLISSLDDAFDDVNMQGTSSAYVPPK